MALVTIVSFGMIDGSGGSRKTLPIYLAATSTDAEIQAFIDDFGLELDACVDAKIVDVSVTKSFPLPLGLKGAAVAGSDINRGALLGFDAANTNYNWSYWIPGWSNAGFSGDAVNNSGVYATLITSIISGPGGGADNEPVDKYGNDLTSFLGGEKKFRK